MLLIKGFIYALIREFKTNIIRTYNGIQLKLSYYTRLAQNMSVNLAKSRCYLFFTVILFKISDMSPLRHDKVSYAYTMASYLLV